MIPIINFFELDNKIHFEIPNDKALEAKVRATIKKQFAAADKAFYFKRGINDAVNSIINNTERKFGTPMVSVYDPFRKETKLMTCQEASELLDLGGTYRIKQVSGTPLPDGYFSSEF